MKSKEPSLLRQIIAIHYEQSKRRKALRILAKQEWSIDFLTLLLRKAADMKKDNLEMEITSKGGHKFIIRSVNAQVDSYTDDNDIFNHLDDEAAIAAFIRDHAPRS